MFWEYNNNGESIKKVCEVTQSLITNYWACVSCKLSYSVIIQFCFSQFNIKFSMKY